MCAEIANDAEVVQKGREIGFVHVIAMRHSVAISTVAHYLAAGPGRVDTIEIAYLEGQEGLYTETRNGFEVDGLEIKARLDVGVGLGDYRWITKNAGQ